jgi:hypothetical protein
MSRDNAAIFFEKKKIHHAIVSKGDDFVGLISSWDVAAECARDLYAWPENRTEDGRYVDVSLFCVTSFASLSHRKPQTMVNAESINDSFLEFLESGPPRLTRDLLTKLESAVGVEISKASEIVFVD